MPQKKKRLLKWSLALGLLAALAAFLYILFGHALLERAYDSGGGAFLRAWFKDRDVIPLQDYLDRSDWAVWSLGYFTFAFIFGMGLAKSLKPRSFLLFLTALTGSCFLLARPLISYLYERNALGFYAKCINFINRIHGIEHTSGSPCVPIPLQEYLQRSDVFIVQIILFLLACGAVVWICQKKRRLLLCTVNLILLVPVFMLAEFYLNLDAVQKKFGSVQWKAYDREINFEKMRRQNRYGFSDKERSFEKAQNTVLRVAVLGDSFVWGHGIPVEDAWSHIMEAKLKEQYGETVEVLNWGKNRWSTYDQFQFLKKEGVKFNPNLLIFGFVTNDPEVPGFCMPLRTFLWDRWVREIPVFRNTFGFFADRVNGFLYGLAAFKDWGYAGWENHLYEGDNWKEYEKLLIELNQFLTERKIPYFFVTLPMPQPKAKGGVLNKYTKIFEVFEQNNIPYADLSGPVNQRFGHLSRQEVKENLWANPVNSHPNRKLTELYAESVIEQIRRYYPENKPR